MFLRIPTILPSWLLTHIPLTTFSSSSSLSPSYPTFSPRFRKNNQPSPYIQLLAKHLNPVTNPSLNHLNALLKNKKELDRYFYHKPIQQYSVEDAYFMLVNQQMFSPLNPQSYLALVSNPYDCFFRFFLAHSLQNRNPPPQADRILIIAFNEACQQMGKQEFLACLNIMKQLRKEIVHEYINIEALRNCVNRGCSKFGTSFYELLDVLAQLDLFSKVVDVDVASQYYRVLQKTITVSQMTIKMLYYIQKSAQYLKIEDLSQLNETFQQLLANRIVELKYGMKEQMGYAVHVLTKFPDLIQYFNISELSAQYYLRILNNLVIRLKTDPQFKVVLHRCPKIVIKTSTSEQFYKIVALRTQLKLQKLNQLGRLSQKTMVMNSEATLGLLKFLKNEQITNIQTWRDFQHGFVQSLQLQSPQKPLQSRLSHHKISTLFNIMGIISKYKLGSIYFWRYCNQFVYDVLTDPDIVKTIQSQVQNLFVISAFRIYQEKAIPDLVENNLKYFGEIALVNNVWSEKELFQLTSSLTASRLVIDEIWIAIQKKVLTLEINKHMKPQDYFTVLRIFRNFEIMKIGSYKLKTYMTKVLKINNLDPESYLEMTKQFLYRGSYVTNSVAEKQ